MQFSTDPKLVRPPKLSEQVAQFLADEIAKGSFKAGENLPSEAKLASRFKVSRTIIREALARLEFEGVVESRRGSKARIAPSNQKRVFRIEQVEKMGSYELGQLYEFRAILEGAAAALTAKRCNKSDLKKLKKCLDTLNEAVEKKIDHLPANVEFHQLIAAASGNSYLRDFMQFLNGKLWEQIEGDRNQFEKPGMPKEVQKEHAGIFNAIKKGDPDRARKAVIQHIINAANRRNIPVDIV